METGVVKYNITDAALAEYEHLYMGLVVKNLDDKAGFEAVHAARMVVKGKRCEVENKRKELKASALEWGRKVDAEAKRIFGKLAPIETHLENEENKVVNERKRIEAEKAEAERQRIQDRVDHLAKYGRIEAFHVVAKMPDDEYGSLLALSQRDWQAEQDRLAAENKAREEEAKRLAAERAELERMRKEQAEKQAAIDAENKRIRKEQEAKDAAIRAEQKKIDDEKRRIENEKRKEQERKDREEFERKAKAQAAAEAAKKAKEDAERKEAERVAKEKADAEEKLRQEALKPEKQKVVEWANSLLDINMPEIENTDLFNAASDTLGIIYEAAHELLRKVEVL